MEPHHGAFAETPYPAGKKLGELTTHPSCSGKVAVDGCHPDEGGLAPLTEPTTGAVAWGATRVRISRVGDPDGRLILFAGAMREHAEHGR